MPNNDIQEVRRHYGALRDLIIQHNGGWNDVVARARLDGLCEAAARSLDDAECHARLRAVRDMAVPLFSQDGHVRWGRTNMSGADYLRLQILISLEALNTRLFFLATARTASAAV